MSGIGHSVQYRGPETGRVAYDSTVLQPRLSSTGRYAPEFRPYVYRGFRKLRQPVAIDDSRPESDPATDGGDASH